MTSAPAPSSGGVFGGISLTASKAPPSFTNKPMFAMPSVQPPSVAKIPTFGGVPKASAPSKTDASEKNKELAKSFKGYFQNMNVRAVHYITALRFTTSILSEEAQKENTTAKEKVAPASSTAKAPAPLFGSTPAPAPAPASTPTTAATNLFTLSKPSPGASAVPKVAFGGNFAPTASFGSSTGAAGGTPTFPFGSKPGTSPKSPTFTLGKNAGTTSTPAPAPSGFDFGSKSASPALSNSSGFSFSAAPVAAAPTPGAGIKVALTPVNGGNDSAAPTEDGEPTILESADGDWDQLLTAKVKVYHYRNENKATKFALGDIKVQQSKTDSSKRRMVLRDGAGKVLLNVGISSGMSFSKSLVKRKTGKSMGSITFIGVMSAEKGAEKFTIVCTDADLDRLHSKFDELSK